MHKSYETELPEGYESIYCIDAMDKKTGIIMNVVAGIIIIAIIAASILIIKPSGFKEIYLVKQMIFLVAMVLYMVLHELVHGVVYWLLTKQKLTFGVSLSCAYCGVPNIYVYRKTALLALLAPFVVFNIVFILAALWVPDPWDKLWIMILFAIHFGGCCGDLYDTFLYLYRFRDPSILMRDTGPMQTFYAKKLN